MFSKKLEVYDPENPTIYYYTNNSTMKPLSFSQKCGQGRKITGYNFKSSKVIVFLGVIYAIFLLYISIGRPQFATNYAKESNRQAFFKSSNINIIGNITPLWLKNNLILTLTIKNTKKEDNIVNIKKISYNLGESKDITIKEIQGNKSLKFKEKESKDFFIELPLNKDQFLPKDVIVNINIDNNIKNIKIEL